MRGNAFLLDPAHAAFAAGAGSRLPAGGYGCILAFMSIFIAAGLLVAGDVARRWVHVALLSTGYAEAQGQVVGRRIVSDEGATYYVTYRFLAGERDCTVEETVDRETYRSVEDGQALTVRYVPRNPAIATIEPGQVGELLLFTGFGLAWNGLVFSISGLLANQIVKRHRLARKGQRIAGEIVDCSARRDDDGHLVLDVRFRFRSPRTRLWIEGKASHPRRDLEGQPLPTAGTEVQVLYLSDRTYMAL